MYTTSNFNSKKELREAVASGRQIGVFNPGLGESPTEGKCCVEGPHFPKPHRWYAEVTLKNGVIVKVV